MAKVTIKTIQFKRGQIAQKPKEAKYGEPVFLHDDENEKYYLYIGMGEGKAPVLVSGEAEIYIGNDEAKANKHVVWINEEGLPDGVVSELLLRENIDLLNANLNELTGLDTSLDDEDEYYISEEEVNEVDAIINGIFDSLNLEESEGEVVEEGSGE